MKRTINDDQEVKSKKLKGETNLNLNSRYEIIQQLIVQDQILDPIAEKLTLLENVEIKNASKILLELIFQLKIHPKFKIFIDNPPTSAKSCCDQIYSSQADHHFQSRHFSCLKGHSIYTNQQYAFELADVWNKNHNQHCLDYKSNLHIVLSSKLPNVLLEIITTYCSETLIKYLYDKLEKQSRKSIIQYASYTVDGHSARGWLGKEETLHLLNCDESANEWLCFPDVPIQGFSKIYTPVQMLLLAFIKYGSNWERATIREILNAIFKYHRQQHISLQEKSMMIKVLVLATYHHFGDLGGLCDSNSYTNIWYEPRIIEKFVFCAPKMFYRKDCKSKKETQIRDLWLTGGEKIDIESCCYHIDKKYSHNI